MRRLTISVEDDLADTFDRLCESRGYGNRSEAFRDLVRGELGRKTIDEGVARDCAATLSYVFDHRTRQLASRLATVQHANREVIVSSIRVDLDGDDFLETLILRGRTARVIEVAQAIIAETGIRHGTVNIVPLNYEAGKKERTQRRLNMAK